MEILCAHCQTKFQAKRSTAKFCSTKCRVQAGRGASTGITAPVKQTNTDELFETAQPGYYKFGNEVTKRTCIQCNKSFETKLPLMKFCSPACRQNQFDEMNQELKKRGLAPVVRGSDIPPISFISSGISEIDVITGGFPRKRVTELFGLKGVGKTTLMSQIIQALPDLRIYYVDAESALSVIPDNVDVTNEFMLEAVSELVDTALQKNYDLIVIDSIASLLPRAELEGSAGDAVMGLKARLMSQWMRRINYYLSKSDTAVVFVNQQRESMNPYGPSKFTPGGLGVPYAASLRLELKSNKADRFEGGHWVNVEIEKSRICKPYQKTKFKLLYV